MSIIILKFKQKYNKFNPIIININYYYCYIFISLSVCQSVPIKKTNLISHKKERPEEDEKFTNTNHRMPKTTAV